MKQIGRIATHAVLAMSASIGSVSAQTPFMIASVSSGQVLDVPGFSTTPGTLIQQYPANGGANQQWTIRRAPAGYYNNYEIVSVSSGQVLDVPGFSTTPGTSIQQYPANGGGNQQWRFYRAAGSTGYQIVSHDQEVLPNPPSGETYINLVLDVPGSSTAPGTPIQQYGENNGANQQWLLYPLGQGNISLGLGQPGTVTVTGWGFRPGTVACPVFDSLFTAPCTTVRANGTFSTTFVSTPFTYFDSTLPGYSVATVEDGGGNVLAIGSISGGFGTGGDPGGCPGKKGPCGRCSGGTCQ